MHGSTLVRDSLMANRLDPLLAAVGLALCAACSPCSNTVRQIIRSPNAKWTAVVFNRTCGATTPFLTHVVINPGQSVETSVSRSVFRARAKYGVARTDTAGGPLLDVVWRGTDSLFIGFDPRATVLTQKDRSQSVAVIYGRLSE